MISNHNVSSGILSPVLFLRDIVMVYYHEGGLEIERADLELHDTNYCSKEFLFHFFISLVLTLIFPPFFANSLPPSLYPFLTLLSFPPIPRPGWN